MDSDRRCFLANLSDELLLAVLSFLDVDDLLSLSRTSHRLRTLCLDPILHAQRLHSAWHRLSLTLQHRPSLSSLLPPAGTIYLSTTHVLARALSRKLVKIRLNRRLLQRPSASSLVKCNILPPECCKKDAGTGEVVWGGGLAPSIVEMKRKVERERLKDGLRAWLERKAKKVEADQHKDGDAWEVVSVKGLVRRITARKRVLDEKASVQLRQKKAHEERWGPHIQEQARRRSEQPTRAHVLGLRKFWEGVAKTQGVGA